MVYTGGGGLNTGGGGLNTGEGGQNTGGDDDPNNYILIDDLLNDENINEIKTKINGADLTPEELLKETTAIVGNPKNVIIKLKSTTIEMLYEQFQVSNTFQLSKALQEYLEDDEN